MEALWNHRIRTIGTLIMMHQFLEALRALVARRLGRYLWSRKRHLTPKIHIPSRSWELGTKTLSGWFRPNNRRPPAIRRSGKSEKKVVGLLRIRRVEALVEKIYIRGGLQERSAKRKMRHFLFIRWRLRKSDSIIFPFPLHILYSDYSSKSVFVRPLSMLRIYGLSRQQTRAGFDVSALEFFLWDL